MIDIKNCDIMKINFILRKEIHNEFIIVLMK